MIRPAQGLKRKTDDGTYYARRAVPEDVRHAYAGRCELVESLKTADLRLAMKRRDEAWSRWTAEFQEARRGGVTTPEMLSRALDGIELWRRQSCEAALGIKFEEPFNLPPAPLPKSAVFSRSAQDAIDEVYRDPLFGLLERRRARRIAPSIGESATVHAERYFAKHPAASRELQMPYAVGILLGRLQAAERDPEAWREIDGFDDQLGSALGEVQVRLKLTPALLETIRHPFAKAWLEVVRHKEAARRRAASFLAAIEAARLDAASIRVASGPRSYVPREDDQTIAELITSYRSDRDGSYGAESTSRKYNHIFTALKEGLGAEKPIRAVTAADCRKVRDLLRSVPAHMGKRYPGKTMAEAIEAADEEDEPQFLAPNTINSYLSNLIALFKWANSQGWAEINPAEGLVDKDLPLLQRRAFHKEELSLVFEGLEEVRGDTPWKFWVPALGLFTGARLNEICQLTKVDVSEYEGTPYLRMTVFDPSGRRSRDKRLKTARSQRNVPLHPQLVTARFLDYVASIGDGRLFPELPRGPNGGFSHYASTWFGGYLDRLGLSDPCLVFHSFRHGFKEACQAADLQDSIWRALGGWAAESVSDKYGQRDAVPILNAGIKKLEFGGFQLKAREVTSTHEMAG
jgi:integrase